MSEISYRPGTAADSYAIFLLFEETFADLARRMGSTEPTSFGDPVALASMWEERRLLYEHLAATAEHFWVAERDGRIVGYARSILRDGLRALTEFFVLAARGLPAPGASFWREPSRPSAPLMPGCSRTPATPTSAGRSRPLARATCTGAPARWLVTATREALLPPGRPGYGRCAWLCRARHQPPR